MLTYDLDKRGNQSLYGYLYRCIRQDIESGAIAADDRLPSKRTLAKHLGVSLITVEGAYAQLQAEGYLYTQERRGYFAMPLPAYPETHADEGAKKAANSMDTAATATLAESASNPDAGGTTTASTACAHATAPEQDTAPQPTIDLAHSPTGSNAEVQRLWARALRATLSAEPDDRHLHPLPPEGSPSLRRAITDHVRAFRGMEADPDNIIVGSGAQTLYNLIVQLLGRDRGYAVEDPGYRRLTSIYQANGATVHHIPLDEQGICPSRLQDSGATVAHIMPSHQFPTGQVTSIARRYELLGWAAQSPERFIIEDDYDCEFRLAGRPIPALQSIDRMGKVIYTNTFAKGLSSDIRVAYLILPPDLMRCYRANLGFYSNTVSAIIQNALARILDSGDYERHINRTRNRHRLLQDALIHALAESPYAERLHPEQTDAGLHFILRIDLPCTEARIVEAARQEGLALAALSDYTQAAASEALAGNEVPFNGRAERETLHGNPAVEAARFVVHYSGLGEDGIPAAVDALSRTIERCL